MTGGKEKQGNGEIDRVEKGQKKDKINSNKLFTSHQDDRDNNYEGSSMNQPKSKA